MSSRPKRKCRWDVRDNVRKNEASTSDSKDTTKDKEKGENSKAAEASSATSNPSASPSQCKTPPSKPGSHAGSPKSGADSPDPNCSICLGTLQNKSFTDSCLHTFCFVCLLEWAKVKAVCPLCKQPFKSIIHNVRSIEDYDQYHLRTDENSGLESPDGSRFRYRTTVTTDRWMMRQQREQNRQLEMLRRPTRLTTRGQWRRGRQAATSAFRSNIYARNMWVRGVTQRGRGPERIRETSPAFFTRNPACTHRLVPWLNRELNMLLNNNESQTQFVQELIMDLIKRFEIQSEEFAEHIRPFTLHRTQHFIHEFYQFARSPCDMIVYDGLAEYGEPETGVTTIDSDNSTTDDSDIIMLSPEEGTAPFQPRRIGEDHDYFFPGFGAAIHPSSIIWPPEQRVPAANSITLTPLLDRVRDFLQVFDTADTAQTGWDSPLPGPSSGMWSPPRPDSPAPVQTEEVVTTVSIKSESGSNSSLDSDSDSSSSSNGSDIIIVGYEKPWENRTPIMLSSADEDEMRMIKEARKRAKKKYNAKIPERYRRLRNRHSSSDSRSRSRSRHRDDRSRHQSSRSHHRSRSRSPSKYDKFRNIRSHEHTHSHSHQSSHARRRSRSRSASHSRSKHSRGNSKDRATSSQEKSARDRRRRSGSVISSSSSRYRSKSKEWSRSSRNRSRSRSQGRSSSKSKRHERKRKRRYRSSSIEIIGEKYGDNYVRHYKHKKSKKSKKHKHHKSEQSKKDKEISTISDSSDVEILDADPSAAASASMQEEEGRPRWKKHPTGHKRSSKKSVDKSEVVPGVETVGVVHSDQSSNITNVGFSADNDSNSVASEHNEPIISNEQTEQQTEKNTSEKQGKNNVQDQQMSTSKSGKHGKDSAELEDGAHSKKTVSGQGKSSIKKGKSEKNTENKSERQHSKKSMSDRGKTNNKKDNYKQSSKENEKCAEKHVKKSDRRVRKSANKNDHKKVKISRPSKGKDERKKQSKSDNAESVSVTVQKKRYIFPIMSYVRSPKDPIPEHTLEQSKEIDYGSTTEEDIDNEPQPGLNVQDSDAAGQPESSAQYSSSVMSIQPGATLQNAATGNSRSSTQDSPAVLLEPGCSAQDSPPVLLKPGCSAQDSPAVLLKPGSIAQSSSADKPTPCTEDSYSVGQLGPSTEDSSLVGQLGPSTEDYSPIGQLGPSTEDYSPIGQLGPSSGDYSPIAQLGPSTEDYSPIGQLGPSTEDSSFVGKPESNTEDSSSPVGPKKPGFSAEDPSAGQFESTSSIQNTPTAETQFSLHDDSGQYSRSDFDNDLAQNNDAKSDNIHATDFIYTPNITEHNSPHSECETNLELHTEEILHTKENNECYKLADEKCLNSPNEISAQKSDDEHIGSVDDDRTEQSAPCDMYSVTMLGSSDVSQSLEPENQEQPNISEHADASSEHHSSQVPNSTFTDIAKKSKDSRPSVPGTIHHNSRPSVPGHIHHNSRPIVPGHIHHKGNSSLTTRLFQEMGIKSNIDHEKTTADTNASDKSDSGLSLSTMQGSSAKVDEFLQAVFGPAGLVNRVPSQEQTRQEQPSSPVMRNDVFLPMVSDSDTDASDLGLTASNQQELGELEKVMRKNIYSRIIQKSAQDNSPAHSDSP